LGDLHHGLPNREDIADVNPVVRHAHHREILPKLAMRIFVNTVQGFPVAIIFLRVGINGLVPTAVVLTIYLYIPVKAVSLYRDCAHDRAFEDPGFDPSALIFDFFVPLRY